MQQFAVCKEDFLKKQVMLKIAHITIIAMASLDRRNQIFHSPGNEEGELAKIPGDGDPPPPHWDL